LASGRTQNEGQDSIVPWHVEDVPKNVLDTGETIMPRSLVLCLTLTAIALQLQCVPAAEKEKKAKKAGQPTVRSLRVVMEKVKPLHKPFGKPRPHDWVVSHPEPGQTFTEYLKCRPVTPTGRQRVIYVQPLGDFTDKQREIVTLSADFMARYFNRPVEIRKDIPLSVIPAKARRKHPSWGMDQILSTYVLDQGHRIKVWNNDSLLAFLLSRLAANNFCDG